MTTPERTVAYFGPGYCLPGDKSGPLLRPNTLYLCFEPPWSTRRPERIMAVETYRLLPPEIKTWVKMIRRSGKKTGLPDSSVDEVHVYNLLTGWKNPRRVEEFIHEGLRIVKPCGSVFTGETRTPEHYPLDRLLALEELAGLKVEIVFDLARGDDRTRAGEIVIEQIGAFYRSLDDTKTRMDDKAYMTRIIKPQNSFISPSLSR